MQTTMNKNTSFFERLLQLSENHGYKNMNELAKALNYDSPAKLYRLKNNPENKPSYDILNDLSNLFEDFSMKWLISGKGEMPNSEHGLDILNEPEYAYTPSRRVPHTADSCIICDQKERIISSLQETIEVYRQSLLIMRQRIDELEKNRQ